MTPMLSDLTNNILYETTYLQLYGLVFCYFLFLYIVLGPLFLSMCKMLTRAGIAHRIIEKEVTGKQIKRELLHSFQSIVIFGFSAFPVIYFIRTGVITLLPDSLANILLGIALLTVWNEVHFYIVHRIMHLPFLMKHVHYVHHKSVTPTVYSVYSFHWLEAVLLSTVPVTLAPFIPIAPLAIFLYPMASILLNFAGHCNYRLGNGKGSGWAHFATRHSAHHHSFSNKFGFASDLLDKLNDQLKKISSSDK